MDPDLPPLLFQPPSGLCLALAMVLLPWLLTAHSMTRETRKPDGKANEAEEHNFGRRLERDLAQEQSGRERADKTGKAGTERERNGCGKNGKRCMAPCMEREGYHLSMLRKGRSVAETEGRNWKLSG